MAPLDLKSKQMTSNGDDAMGQEAGRVTLCDP